MATVKIRHLVTRRGKGGIPAYYYLAKPAMTKHGIQSEPLGKNLAKAIERAEFLNRMWDEKRTTVDELPKARPSSLTWLIEKYKASSWFLKLAPGTRTQAEAHLKSIARSPLASRGVVVIERSDCRELYEQVWRKKGPHVAKDRLKWFRRVLSYGVEVGIIERNPALKMEIEEPPHRVEVWTPAEIEEFKASAIAAGYFAWALAVQLGYDTSQRLSDILTLTWHQFDGEGVTFKQTKTGREVWVPLSPETLAMLAKTPKRAVHILTGTVRGRPIRHRSYFGRVFREIRAAAPMRQHLTFHDLRRTAATEIYSGGGHIEPITGHRAGSVAIRRYVVPNKAAAREAQRARKRNKNDEKV